ncbi:MAG TPA: ABC transporter ATP-binding protein [Coleofasciculaceae cyanobacterium]
MARRKFLWQLIRRYPQQALWTMAMGFSGALFNGVSTALIVPVVLRFLGQEAVLAGGPPILRRLFAPFDSLPVDYQPLAMAAAVVGTIALKNLATYFSALAVGVLQRSLAADMRMDSIQMLLNVNLSYFARTRIGDINNRLGNEIGRVSSTVANLLQLVATIVSIAVMVGLLVLLSWQLTVVATVLFAGVVWINQLYVNQSRQLGKEVSQTSKDYSVALLEILGGIRLVRSAAMETREFDRMNRLTKAREAAEFKSQANSIAIAPVTEVVSVVMLMAIVGISRWLFADQLSALSTVLLTYLTLLFRLLPLVAQLNRLRGQLANTAASVDVVEDFLRSSNKSFLINGSEPFPGLKQALRFEHLSFAYEGSNELTLQDITLTLPKGTTLALVGSSGAGKSTLVELVPRFADPTSGRITIDGRDLREFEVRSLRRSLGIVSQETFLFNDTIRNNIAYPMPTASDDAVIAAAKMANAMEFIERMPRGLDTMIGDRGVMLSGGQRQRLAIARALLQNPPILILDEATSALDTVSERLVQEAIEALSRDRTVIAIAHRLSTVQRADQIAVLDKGRVVEVGNHAELLAKGGAYAKLYTMQFGSTQPQQPLATASETFNRTSYEIRARLNITVGSLQLLVDDLVDNTEERQELLRESYRSAIRMLSTMELFEDALQVQRSFYSESGVAALAERYETFANISYQVRSRLNDIIGALRLILDDLTDEPDEDDRILHETYASALEILNILESLEATGNQA